MSSGKTPAMTRVMTRHFAVMTTSLTGTSLQYGTNSPDLPRYSVAGTMTLPFDATTISREGIVFTR